MGEHTHSEISQAWANAQSDLPKGWKVLSVSGGPPVPAVGKEFKPLVNNWPMRITFEVHDDEWRHAAGALLELMRPPAPWTESVRRPSCEHVWTIGPVGDAWFEQGSRRVGYFGSLLYLACGLADWQRSGESHVIESEPAYQSPDVELKRGDGNVTVTVRSVQGPAPLHVSLDDLRTATSNFLDDFGGAAATRIPGLRDVEGLDWLPT